MDGHWNGSGDWGGLIFVPSVDELQEFRIQTNTFSPQYGWSMGNAVNAITKSGTNGFHGGVFEFLRNGHLDANNFFSNRNGVPRPMVKRNQFGFNLGGPLRREKTFFFGSYEGLRQQTPTSSGLLTVPTLDHRRGDFSRTFNSDGSPTVIYNPFTTRRLPEGTFTRDPFVGNRLPQEMLDPVSVRLMTFFPAPTRPGNPLTGAGNFISALGLPFNSDQYTIRVDHNIAQSQRLFARWSQKRQFIQGVGPFYGRDNPAGMGLQEPNPRWDIGLGYNYAITPSLVMSGTLGWGRWVEEIHPQGVPFQPSSLGLPAALDNPGGPGGFPVITVDGVPRGLGGGALVRTPRETHTYALDLTHTKGRHTLTFGFMALDFRLANSTSAVASFAFQRNFTQGPDPLRAAPTTGSGIAALLLGTGSAGGIFPHGDRQGISLSAQAAFNKNLYAWYFNDDFRLRRNLTLNLGVRYDFQKAPTDRFDRLTYWTLERNTLSDSTGLNLTGGLRHTGGGNPRGVYDPRYTNIAPRMGFTYSPLNRLVIRGGFGVFFMTAMEIGLDPLGISQGLALDGFTQFTPYVGTLDGVRPLNQLRNPFPSGLLLPTSKILGDRTFLGLPVNAVERARPTPYVEQWTFGLQYQLQASTVLEASYVGNHGVKLPFAGFQRNQLRPELLGLGVGLLDLVPNPFLGLIPAGPVAYPTVTRGQLLRPYPQFDSVLAVQSPAGMSTYHALMLSANRRFSGGLQFQVSFTGSKYLTNTEGPEGRITQSQSYQIRNFYDTSLEKSLMNDDIPRSLVMNYIYELPVGRGKRFAPGSKVADAIAGGWQVSGISTFKSGFPLGIIAIGNNTNSFGGNQRPNLVGNAKVEQPTPDRWFNTSAFAQPAPFTFGNVPRTMPNLRAHGTNNFDFSVQKRWGLWSEQARLQFRTEFFNFFNRPTFYNPWSFFGDPNFGLVRQAYPARSIQLGLKLNW